MPTLKLPPVRNVLILKTDLMVAEAIKRVAALVWPRARFRIVQRLRSARAALRSAPVDVLLTGLGMLDGDVCALVRAAARSPRRVRRIVVVTGRRDPRFISLLGSLPVDGAYHTATDGLRNLPRVLRAVERGERYFSRRFVTLLREQEQSQDGVFCVLTEAELHALAVFGEGCDCKEAAYNLRLGIETVRSLHRALHRKLGVRHKGELMKLAQREGMVRIRTDRVECLDAKELARRHEAAGRRKRRIYGFTHPREGAPRRRADLAAAAQSESGRNFSPILG